MTLFLDRLSVHRTLRVKKESEKLKLPLIFNASYSPDYNPIESAIGLAKAFVKRERWKNLQNGTEMKDEELIKKGFDKISVTTLRKFIKKS